MRLIHIDHVPRFDSFIMHMDEQQTIR